MRALVARAPASSSNLGPGFDVLGLALELYVEVEVRPAERFSLHSQGEGANIAADSHHLAAKTVVSVLGHDHVAIDVRSEIPVGRGLGSSAALVAAAAAAAGAPDPLLLAARADGHPENAAASVLGGLVAATLVEDRPIVRRLALDEALCFVVLVPDHELSTALARSVLPQMVPFGDATKSLGRLGLLIAGLANRADLVEEAGEEFLHERARTPLFPQAPELLAALRAAGATVACWSGAGPSLIGICTSESTARAVRDEGEQALSRAGVAGRALLLRADRNGLTVGDAPS